MLFGNLNHPQTYAAFLAHPIWREALDWIRRMDPNHPIGIYEIKGPQMYVNVHGYQTLAREKCRYESHRTHVDLQYCIRGGELIEWHLAGDLEPQDEHDPGKDVRHFHAPAAEGTVLRMTPGTFAIFFPPDGHMPKRADGIHRNVEKLVIKISKDLLALAH